MYAYFTELTSSSDPATDVERFYRMVGRLDTLAHVTLVAAEARALAEQFGLDLATANLAALAHDLAAVVPVDERPTVAESMGIELSAADRALPALLHGPIAAAALVARLGIQDKDLLNQRKELPNRRNDRFNLAHDGHRQPQKKGGPIPGSTFLDHPGMWNGRTTSVAHPPPKPRPR